MPYRKGKFLKEYTLCTSTDNILRGIRLHYIILCSFSGYYDDTIIYSNLPFKKDMKNIDEVIFTTNSRLLRDHLNHYKNTFYALCELINNSLQANAKNIYLTIEYNKGLDKSPINKIILLDDGWGVPVGEFEKCILEVGTDAKKDGLGVGRFAALQIGSYLEIETVGFDKILNKFTKTILPVNSTSFENKRTQDVKIKATKEVLSGNKNSFYKVTIKSLYHNQTEKTNKRNAIAKELLDENIRLALFQMYPYEIFNDKVKFHFNEKRLLKKEFIYSDPTHLNRKFIDKKGNGHSVDFYFYNVKLKESSAKVFFQIDNAGLKSVVNSYSYSSEWFTPELGNWFIYIESPFFTIDLFKNIDLDELGEEGIDSLKNFAKDVITSFFITINKKFDNFKTELKEVYPAYSDSETAGETQKILFEQLAFLIEQKYKLIAKDAGIKEVFFPLLERSIADGNVTQILNSILKSDKKTTDKFKKLLDSTDIESVVHFNSEIAEKIQFLNFLHDINYGDISQFVAERKVLHKIVEKQLWLFGESYNGIPTILWSDRKVLGIFNELRSKYITYHPTTEDDNLVEFNDSKLNDITDLFFTNERKLDDGSTEYMIVELKAPKCKLSQKEISQIKRYSFAIESSAPLPKHKTKYKLLLISADINPQAKSELKAISDAYKVPFLLEKKTDVNIEIYMMTWSELINLQRGKLNYLSQYLKVKDKSVKEKFMEEYPHLIDQKLKTVLRKIA
jgi:hypothetical protein